MPVYLLTFDRAPRVESRVMQIFDHQGVAVTSFAVMRIGAKIQMRIVADAGAWSESRLAALILRIEGARSFTSNPSEAPDAGGLRFQIDRYGLEHGSLLQMLLVAGATIVTVSGDSISFEAHGSSEEVVALRSDLESYCSECALTLRALP